jgi:hypothetical protein
MAAREAAERAKYILSKWKFKFWSIPGGIRFERSVPLAGLAAINPHDVHSRIDMLFMEKEDGSCEITIRHQVFKLGRPGSTLDDQVWLGDLEDLEAGLLKREEPKIDRARQNRYAGRMYFKYCFFVVIPLFGVATWLVFDGRFLAALLCIVVFIGTLILMPFLPFRMPYFPLDNKVPDAPFTSNYPRMRH